jgi:hypothetical protein
MAIRSVGGEDRETSPAADLIRERARVAVAKSAEQAARVERGIGDAAAVELSAAARSRAGLGSAVVQRETATDRVPPPRRSRSIPEVGKPPPPPPVSRPDVADTRRRDSRRQAQVKSTTRGTDRAVGKRNRVFREKVTEAREQKQIERANKAQRNRES